MTTEEELRAVERLRYECYVARMHRGRPSVDHRRRLMPLPADERSPILYAVAEGEVVGTVRIRHGRLGPYTPEERAGFAPDMFEPVVRVEDTMLQDTFVIRDDHLGGPVRLRLFLASAQYAISEGVDLVFCACLPHLVRTYRRLGFRTYKATADFPEGILVPMVAVVHDLDYLESIDAPLRVAFESAGVELDRRRGREIAGLLSTYQHVVAHDDIDRLLAEGNIIGAPGGESVLRRLFDADPRPAGRLAMNLGGVLSAPRATT